MIAIVINVNCCLFGNISSALLRHCFFDQIKASLLLVFIKSCLIFEEMRRYHTLSLLPHAAHLINCASVGQTRTNFRIRPDVQGLTLDLMQSQGLPPFVVLLPGVFLRQSLNREGGQLRLPSVIFLGLIPRPKTSARARPQLSRLSTGIS